jgi:hypothetical protein
VPSLTRRAPSTGCGTLNASLALMNAVPMQVVSETSVTPTPAWLKSTMATLRRATSAMPSGQVRHASALWLPATCGRYGDEGWWCGAAGLSSARNLPC